MEFGEESPAAEIQLNNAIEAMPGSFAVWDKNNQLVLCNSQFQQLYCLTDDCIALGTSTK